MRECREEILALVDRLQNEAYAEFRVNPRLIPLLIGTKANKIRKLCEEFTNVEIDFPPHGKNTLEDDLIKIKGHKYEVNKQ